MKKLLFSCAIMCAFGAVSASAQSINDSFTLSKNIYYGEKARPDWENPCKGKCMKKCAEIENLIVAPNPGDCGAVAFSSGGGHTLVKSIMKDADGNVIAEKEEVYDGDVYTVKNQLDAEAAMNGADVVTE